MILLVTNQRDLTMDYVVRELKNRDIPFFRLNTEQLPLSSSSMGINNADDWKININGCDISGDIVKAAYFRRPGIPDEETLKITGGHKEYLINEWMSFLKNLYWRLDGRWLNSPTSIVLSEDKPKQLILARKVGFSIPDTYISNDVSCVMNLQKKHDLIAKPLKQALLGGDNEKVIFTTRIDEVSEEHSKSLKLAPVIFQSEIEKKFDVRVTVIGEKIFPVAIWSQVSNETTVDWRKGGKIDLKHECIQLPNDIEKMCFELIKILDLKFGAIDFVCDKNDKYWFLEINPNGQWAWIENQTKLPIAAQIVNELLKISDKK
ncbi:MvdC/MvdD family ATP grasp protein [Enterovibrio norvegicus]